MNDFTKDELQALHYCVNPVRINPDFCDELKQKIQAMIDNYCEHTNKQYYERVNIYECDNCHMTML